MNNKTDGWIGVDLDGTLAEYHHWVGPSHIGPPIPQMVERVKRWLAEGKVVKVFTSRVCREIYPGQVIFAIKAINNFCLDNFGHKLPITCVKDQLMIQMWDDRAVSVERNTGRQRCSCHDGETI